MSPRPSGKYRNAAGASASRTAAPQRRVARRRARAAHAGKRRRSARPARTGRLAPISASRAHPLRMAHRQFGRDPAADAMADQIEMREPERIEHFEIVEHHIVDAAAVGELVAAGAARMRRRDHPCGLRRAADGMAGSRRRPRARRRSRADRRADRRCRFEHRHLAAAGRPDTVTHGAISGMRSMPGNAAANSLAESSLQPRRDLARRTAACSCG